MASEEDCWNVWDRKAEDLLVEIEETPEAVVTPEVDEKPAQEESSKTSEVVSTKVDDTMKYFFNELKRLFDLNDLLYLSLSKSCSPRLLSRVWELLQSDSWVIFGSEANIWLLPIIYHGIQGTLVYGLGKTPSQIRNQKFLIRFKTFIEKNLCETFRPYGSYLNYRCLRLNRNLIEQLKGV